jgi:hypothetical protein
LAFIFLTKLINKGGKTAYHLISRTALNGFPFGDVEEDMLVEIKGINDGFY